MAKTAVSFKRNDEKSPMKKNIMIVDEAWKLLNNNDDALKERLRSIEGIPDASYKVKDGHVFVFDKLLQMVKQKIKDGQLRDSDLSSGEILELSKGAWISAEEAIATWGVIPRSYQTEQHDGEYTIHHSHLFSAIPQKYTTLAELNVALTKLLVGDTLEAQGKADFSYKGQPLQLKKSFDLKSLPEKPVFDIANLPISPTDQLFSSSNFFDAEYIEGFSIFSREDFQTLISLASEWREIKNKISNAISMNNIWAMAINYNLSILNAQVKHDAKLDTEEKYNVGILRQLYPELTTLSDTALFMQYDCFESYLRYTETCSCCWSPEREDDFLFHLIGQLGSTSELEATKARDLGMYMLFQGQEGIPEDTAIQTGLNALEYGSALTTMEWEIACIMRYLANDSKVERLQGHNIVTLHDTSRQSRKFNGKMINISQSRIDL